MAAISGLKPAPRALTIPARTGVIAVALLAALLLGAAIGLGFSPTVVLIGVLAPFVVLLALARPHWATILYVVLVYADLLSILVRYHGMPPLARFAGLALLSTVLGYRLFVKREKLAADRITLWIVAYGAVVALGLLYARAPDLVMENVVEFIRNFFTYLIIINIITTSARLHAALYAMLGAGTTLASLTLFQSLTGTFDNDYGGLAQYRVSDIAGSTEGARPGGTLGDANYYGQLLLILIPIALYLMFEGRSRLGRFVGLVCAAILTAAVIFTYSRGDAIALGVIVLAAVLYKRPNPLWVVGGLVALVLALPLLPANYLARLSTVIDVAEGNRQTIIGEDSIRGRAGATQAAISMFLDYPLLGVGRENYPLYQPEYLSGTPFARVAGGIPPHNLYLEVAAENGIVGIVVFGGMLLATFGALSGARRQYRLTGRNKDGTLVGWLAIMLIGYLVSAVSLHGAFMYVLWLQVSLIAAARRIAYTDATSKQVDVASVGGLDLYDAAADSGPDRVGTSRQVEPRDAALAANVDTGAREMAERNTSGPGYQESEKAWAKGRSDTGELWVAAAEAALRMNDVKVARAMVDLGLERDPYSARAWTMHLRVQRVEQGSSPRLELYGHASKVIEAAERAAFQAAGEDILPTHEVSTKLYSYWHENGGVPIFGYPISARFAEISDNGKIIEVQYFERARLEKHVSQERGSFQIVPGKLGLAVPIRATAAVQKFSGLEEEEMILTPSGVGILTPRKFFAFWRTHGGPAIFGYPSTPLLIDHDDADRPLAVQYFECVRLEYHPWLEGTVYEVQISRLGIEVFQSKYGGKV